MLPCQTTTQSSSTKDGDTRLYMHHTTCLLVNEAAPQRSTVDKITVTFNQPVEISDPDQAVRIIHVGTGNEVSKVVSMSIVESRTVMDLTFVQSSMVTAMNISFELLRVCSLHDTTRRHRRCCQAQTLI